MVVINIDESTSLYYECPKCGEEIELGKSFCEHCGSAIEWKEGE